MRTAAHALFWATKQQTAPDGTTLSSSERHVLIQIADHAGVKCVAWLGNNTLSRETGLSGSTVRRAVRELEAKGLLTTVRGGGTRANTYSLVMDPAPVESPTPEPEESPEPVVEAPAEVPAAEELQPFEASTVPTAEEIIVAFGEGVAELVDGNPGNPLAGYKQAYLQIDAVVAATEGEVKRTSLTHAIVFDALKRYRPEHTEQASGLFRACDAMPSDACYWIARAINLTCHNDLDDPKRLVGYIRKAAAAHRAEHLTDSFWESTDTITTQELQAA